VGERAGSSSYRADMRLWPVRIVCFLILCGILSLGLWPFHPPRNDVTWVGDGDGLQFGSFGTIRSSGTFQIVSSPGEASSSLEIWFEPELTSDSNTLLAFSKPLNPLQFSLHQNRSNLILRREVRGGQRASETIGINDVFRHGRPVFVTITSSPRGSAMYVDGVLTSTFPHFHFADDFTGQLEIGTSPLENDTWQGILKGLALYCRELTASTVRRHYETWIKYGRPEISNGERVIALYLFNEHAGNIVHNAVRPGVDLDIPQRYSILYQIRFEPFWKEYRPLREHWMDFLLNVIGFVPLGFAFCAYWASMRPIRWALILTTCVGFAVSLTIEFLQSYLPTRHSGTADLFTNTLGTFVGAKLYASTAVQRSLGPLNRILFVKRGRQL
jgi:VanZ family protein